MKKIYQIARAELQTLFYSPVAWLILVIFSVQTAILFTDTLQQRLVSISLGYHFGGLTSWALDFRDVQAYLYLYMPLLTMGLMSRETSSGSIKLLYSSPVTNEQIILGKYLAMLLYGLVLTSILSLLALLGVFTISHIDLPIVLTSLLGLYLQICVYAAIGLFMSTLTGYQVVAAMGTLALFALLNMVGRWWQSIEIMRDVTFWLSITGRANAMLNGLLVSEDLLYFVIVISLFLSLSILRLRTEREKRTRLVNTARFATVILIAMTLGYITSRPALKGYIDVTRTKANTLTPASQNIVKRAKGGLTITTYVNLFDKDRDRGLPYVVNYDRQTLEDYIRFKPEIKMDYVYYYHEVPDGGNTNDKFPGLNDKQKAQRICDIMGLDLSLFKTPKEIDAMIDLEPEQYHFVRLLQRDSGQKVFLRMFNDMQRYPGESEISAALKRIVMKLPTVAFLTGHGERSPGNIGDRGYNLMASSTTFRYALISQGFAVQDLNLSGDHPVPPDVSVIVIAEPRTPLADNEKTKLEAWIAAGGNLVIAGEPGRQELVNPLLAPLGVQLMPGRLVQPRKDFASDLILATATPAAPKLAYRFGDLKENGLGLSLPGCAGLAYTSDKGFTVTPLFTTPAKGSWNELETTDFVDDIPVINRQIGEEERSIPTILALNRRIGTKDQRIIVLGDADCMDNAELFGNRKGIRSANYTLATSLFYWLSEGEAPIDDRRPKLIDDSLNLTRESLSILKLIFVWIIPGLLAVTGTILWIRRKRR